MSRRSEIVRRFHRAFAERDRTVVEQMLVEEFRFSAPPDPSLDRAGFFERCWPGAGTVIDFEFVRLLEVGDEVVVTYEMTGPGGTGAGTPRS